MKQGALVVIEPGAGEPRGHMRDKLLVFTRRLEERGIPFHVFSWLRPIDPYASVVAVADTPAGKWLDWIPARFKVKFLEFLTYRAAFKFAASHHFPVMGLTISSPWGLVPARWLVGLKTPYIQRILYIGVHGTGQDLRVRKVIMGALQMALGANGMAALTTQFQDDLFKQHRPLPGGRNPPSELIPEFILYDAATQSSKDRENALLIVGGDDHRRSPVRHLCEASLRFPFEKILLHIAGQETREDKSVSALEKSAARQVIWSNEQLVGAELLGLFARAKYCFVAYQSAFAQTSSIALQSLVCGVPVLISKFPDSVKLGETFGKIGEFFDYSDSESLERAIHRLLNWSEDDWKEFAACRAKLIAYCGYDRGVDHCLEILGLPKRLQDF